MSRRSSGTTRSGGRKGSADDRPHSRAAHGRRRLHCSVRPVVGPRRVSPYAGPRFHNPDTPS
jgi:hypothetical protein